MNKRIASGLIAASLAVTPAAHAQVEVDFWFGLGGALAEVVKEVAEDFNKSQKEYKVIATYKGNYADTLTAAIAAYRAKQPPAIVQVYEVGTGAMMAAKGAVYPVHQLMADTKQPFNPADYVAPVFAYYSSADGKLLSMPFNSSTAIMFWNKEHFRKAGLNPDVGPKTWNDIGEMSAKIIASGASKCGLTVEYAPWTLLESQGTWHDKITATHQNGFGGKGTRLVFNDELRVRLVGLLGEWQKDGRFKYYGRETKSLANFTSGECSFHFASSALTRQIAMALGDNYGVTLPPYFPDIRPEPQNSLMGGATLWVLNGKQKEVYVGVAKFFNYISSPEVQAKWHQKTGYVPTTVAAYELTKKQGFYEKTRPPRSPIRRSPSIRRLPTPAAFAWATSSRSARSRTRSLRLPGTVRRPPSRQWTPLSSRPMSS